MKSVLAICTLFLAAALVRGDEEGHLQKFIDATKEHFTPCAAEAGLSLSVPSMDPSTLSPENMDKLNCVYACVMKQLGIMDAGQIVAGKMEEFIKTTFGEEAAKFAENSETCVAEANGAGDECGVMKSLSECLKKIE